MKENRQLVFGHFRVASQPDGSPMELGRGAMGVTYKAFDERLRIDVALKLIAPAQVDNPKAQSSFLREARAAARVHHSNVASVVYLNDTPGNFFYAMEFVEGQSLRDWMREQHVVPPATAIALAIQIARGLEAIHEQHLVHRDLKPANVMLVKSQTTAGTVRHESDPDAWKVKIIDFGLARVISSDGSGGVAATQTAGFHGTALYASPEQCEERTDLDGRSDFYSLGCILWEMLCGTPPFRARTHRALMNQHVSEPLPLDRLAHLPPSLAAVVARLLIKDPVNRFPNAAALVKALERAREKIESGEEVVADVQATTVDPAGAMPSSGTPRSPSAGTPSPSSTTGGSRRDLLVAAAAVLALLVPGWMIYSARKAESGPARPTADITTSPVNSNVATKKTVAVLPFANLSSEKENEYFAAGMYEEVVDSLMKIGGLRVISLSSLQPAKTDSDRNIRDIARDFGAGAILDGSVRRSGKGVRVTIKLIDPETSQTLLAESYGEELTDSLTIQSKIAVAIAAALRANLAPTERTELARTVTTNAVASPLYLKARGLLADLSDVRNYQEAESALTAAIEADPNFAQAHAWLSILHTLKFDWLGRSPDQLLLALRSAETALRLQPSLPEGQLAMGMYFSRGLRDSAQALPYFQRTLDARPGDAEALSEVAAIQRRQGNWVEAAEKFALVATVNPYDARKQYQAANTYAFMRRYDDAWRILERAMSRMPENAQLKVLKGNLFLAWKGDLDPMRDDFSTRSPTVPSEEIYLYQKIQMLLFERKFDEALAELRGSKFQVMKGQAEFITRDGLEAEILTQAGRTTEARVVWKRVCRELAPLVAAGPGEAGIRMAYAIALAGTGEDADEAVREARTATAEVTVGKDAMNGPFYQAGLALVLLRANRVDEARQIVAQVRAIPSIYYDSMFNLSPAWDALRPAAKL